MSTMVIHLAAMLMAAILTVSCGRVTGEAKPGASDVRRNSESRAASESNPCDLEGAQEIESSLDRVPEAVRATAIREAGGNPIVGVEEIRTGGSTFYEVEWMDRETEVEVLIRPDGNVTCRSGKSASETTDQDENDSN